MSGVLDPFRFVLIVVAGWMNQRQLQVIDYLREENRVLREHASLPLLADSIHWIDRCRAAPAGMPLRVRRQDQ